MTSQSLTPTPSSSSGSTAKRSLNYVSTIVKPSSVTHSCVGNLTGGEDRHLVIAKCTRLEIHLVCSLPNGFQLKSIFDEPLYGRIATLQLFRPPDAAQDLLFIATEKYQISILKWNADPNNPRLVTLSTMDFDSTGPVPKADNGQIGIIDPDCRCIGLHLFDGVLNIIPLNNNGLLQQAFDIRLEELEVLDIKFLYGCPQPTIVVLYQDDRYLCHLKTLKITLVEEGFVQGPWSKNNLVVNGPDSLIPVREPLCGVLIIGEDIIVYCSAADGSVSTAISPPLITKSHGRVDPDFSRYLLGSDHTGLLSRIVITHEQNSVTGLTIEQLGKTSIASTVSYLGDEFVYVGSSYGDSQLIKLKKQLDAEGFYVEVLESYANLGPIDDFCVAGFGRPCQGQVVTCSGAYKDSSLRAAYNAFGINEHVSIKFVGIKGMWSLRSSTDAGFDNFLIVSFISETRILSMNAEDELEETEIPGFDSEVQTIFCHDAVHNQLVQVTSKSVRLVSSATKELLAEWPVPLDSAINVATANSSQVLLATGEKQLFYLIIENGTLEEVNHTQLEYGISCLDINLMDIAAVGTWTDISVLLFSLPGLELKRKEHLGGVIIPRSVLLCQLDGISYLLCALGDGRLFKFLLNLSTGDLTDRKEVYLGTQPTTLRTFSSKNITHVFCASDRPTVIYSKNQRVVYSNVNLKEVTHMCPFTPAAFPDSLAIAIEDKLTICSIDDAPKLHVRSIPLDQQYAQRVCHQEQSGTFAVCSFEYNEGAEKHFVRLLDDRTFGFISEYALNPHEYGCCIISCSFSDDNNVYYYCVGTACVLPEGNGPTKGRILVFSTDREKLQLIAQKETTGAVNCLNAFIGKLLVAAGKMIQLYDWVLCEDASRELKYEVGCYGTTLPLHVQTRGDLIVVGDLMKSTSWFIYKHGEGVSELIDGDLKSNRMAAVEFLDDDTCLGAENSFNLFTVQTDDLRTYLEDAGRFHLGELVKRFRGLLVGGIQTVIFGTVNGVIGVITSLPQQEYDLLEKLQSSMRNVITGVGGLSHKKWRSFNNEYETVEASNFLDGDFIELFLDLDNAKRDAISTEMEVPAEELANKVRELSRLSSLEAFESY